MNGKSTENNKLNRKISSITAIWKRKNEQIVTDPNGSYTGNAVDSNYPEQDPDDL